MIKNRESEGPSAFKTCFGHGEAVIIWKNNENVLRNIQFTLEYNMGHYNVILLSILEKFQFSSLGVQFSAMCPNMTCSDGKYGLKTCLQ